MPAGVIVDCSQLEGGRHTGDPPRVLQAPSFPIHTHTHLRMHSLLQFGCYKHRSKAVTLKKDRCKNIKKLKRQVYSLLPNRPV